MNEAAAKVLSGYKEIAAFLGVSTRTIQRHLKTIPVARLGGKILILENDLVSWVQGRIEKAPSRRLRSRLSK
jgi:excisionase family DNA binding protein